MSTGKKTSLDIMREEWRAVARYRIVRCDRFPEAKRTVIDSGLTLDEAKAKCDPLDQAVWSEMGHDNMTFGRTLHVPELENKDEALLLYRQAIARLDVYGAGFQKMDSGSGCEA